MRDAGYDDGDDRAGAGHRAQAGAGAGPGRAGARGRAVPGLPADPVRRRSPSSSTATTRSSRSCSKTAAKMSPAGLAARPERCRSRPRRAALLGPALAPTPDAAAGAPRRGRLAPASVTRSMTGVRNDPGGRAHVSDEGHSEDDPPKSPPRPGRVPGAARRRRRRLPDRRPRPRRRRRAARCAAAPGAVRGRHPAAAGPWHRAPTRRRIDGSRVRRRRRRRRASGARAAPDPPCASRAATDAARCPWRRRAPESRRARRRRPGPGGDGAATAPGPNPARARRAEPVRAAVAAHPDAAVAPQLTPTGADGGPRPPIARARVRRRAAGPGTAVRRAAAHLVRYRAPALSGPPGRRAPPVPAPGLPGAAGCRRPVRRCPAARRHVPFGGRVRPARARRRRPPRPRARGRPPQRRRHAGRQGRLRRARRPCSSEATWSRSWSRAGSRRAGVAALVEGKVVLVNERQWKPDVVVLPVDNDLAVQGWQDERTASALLRSATARRWSSASPTVAWRSRWPNASASPGAIGAAAGPRPAVPPPPPLHVSRQRLVAAPGRPC